MKNTRLRRRAQFSATCFGVTGSGVRLLAVDLRPAGVIAARSAALAAKILISRQMHARVVSSC
jgi:hypothetical protein